MFKYRVHWLLHLLPIDFVKAYDFNFDYAIHNYAFYRVVKSKFIDCFVVVRTSLKCWRITYTNVKYKISLYRSFRSVGESMNFIYKIYLKYQS